MGVDERHARPLQHEGLADPDGSLQVSLLVTVHEALDLGVQGDQVLGIVLHRRWLAAAGRG